MKHVDADTSWVMVDMGFDAHLKLTIRWANINAPEKRTPEGEAARKALLERLPEGSTCILQTLKDRKEKFGRYLGIFIHPDGTNMNEWLIEQGHATVYKGAA